MPERKVTPIPKSKGRKRKPVEVVDGIRLTDRNRKISAVKEETTRLCSWIVRTQRGPKCEGWCDNPATDHAHIVGRTLAHTRTDESNGLALCGTCHHRFDNWLDDRLDLIHRTIGMDEYLRLKRKAQDGVAIKFDWFAELDRLKAIQRRMNPVPRIVIPKSGCTCEEPTDDRWWERPPHDPDCPLNPNGDAA